MTEPRTAEDIRDWIVDQLTRQMNVKPQHLDLDESIEYQGIDSMQLAVLVGQLEEWLGCQFTANPLFHHSSVNAISVFLAEQLQQGNTVIDPATPTK